ncbi:MAG: neuraminidase-like domain-containing protein [Blastocatellia bacterium]|nr:neuraminidase-like domain-containing protein [Blastocatellia bacterium]
MPTITGFIRTETGAPALNATVRAFDKDLRHEEQLGETIVSETSGRFEIAYATGQFRRAEKRSADLIVRVWDEQGNLRAQSAVIFNAPEVVTINLTFDPSQTRALSEFEQLVISLQPLLDGIEPADLTEEDVTFLIGEDRQPRQRVEFLQRSAQLNRETLIPTEAFYGWGRRRLPLELDRLLAEPFERLRRELATASQQQIIPDMSAQFDFIADRLDALQLETGRRTLHTFIGQLIEDATGRPLRAYGVIASDPSSAEIGQDVTDDRGFFSFPFTLAAANGGNPQQTGRSVELAIRDSNGINVSRANVMATSDQRDVVVVRVALPPRVDETDAPIESIASSELATRLRERGFTTLNDLKTRDLSGIDNGDPELVRLIGHARLSLLSSNAAERDAILTAGFRDSMAIARARRSEFVTSTQEQLGDARAARIHTEALAHLSLVKNITANTRVMAQLNPALVADDLPITIPPQPCGCADCQSAVSPGAYLTELADYAVRHLSRNGQEMTLAGLEDLFHQPISGLRVDCGSVDEQVRQARIAIEALRSFLQLPPSGGGGGLAPQPDPVFIRNQRHYLNSAYANLLAQIGTSYDEVRRLPHADAETRQAAAERLGLAEENLDALFFDMNAAQPVFFEDDLELRFGLRDTRRPPLEPAPVSDLERWRLAHLRTLWAASDHNPVNVRPIIDPHLIGPQNLVDPVEGNAAFELWDARRAWAGARHLALRLARQAAPTSTAGLEALFNASKLGVSASILTEFAEAEAAGESLTGRLAEIGLNYESYTLLRRLNELATGQISILDSEWDEACDIILLAEKNLSASEWRAQEQAANIVLGPDLFAIRAKDPDRADASPWLWDWRAYKDWKATLTARIDQERAVIASLKASVAATEEATLLILRDALVNASDEEAGQTFEAKTKWLGNRLQIDLKAGSCQTTTRVSQAIVSLQTLLWRARTGQLDSAISNLILDADYFDAEWEWLGSYAAWRSAVFVFLFPENLLHPNLRRNRTPVYDRVVRQLPARVTPQAACSAAAAYAKYFRDITTLRPEASCTARARIAKGDPCQSTSVVERERFFMFARSIESGAIYWSTCDTVARRRRAGDPDGFAQSFWEPLTSFGNSKVLELVGAAPMETKDGDRRLFLFAKLEDNQKQKLAFVSYPLSISGGAWSSSATLLDLPPLLETFEVVADQASQNGRVRFVLAAGGLNAQTRNFSAEADGWEGENFEPVELFRSYSHLCTLIASSGGFHLVAQTSDGALFFDEYVKNSEAAPWELNSSEVALADRTAEIGAAQGEHKEWIGSIKTGFSVGSDIGPIAPAYVFWRKHSQTYYSVMPRVATTLSPSAPRSINANLTAIARDLGAVEIDEARHIFIERSGPGKVYRAEFEATIEEMENPFIPGSTVQVAAPRVKEPRDIPSRLTGPELQIRRTMIENIFSYNEGAPRSNFVYLQEAYYSLPFHLALELQKSGHYEAALDLIRTVYDYAAPRETRKIYYGLVAEESLSAGADDDRPQNWLRDPLNPHGIAETRRNSHTFFTLLSLVRCLLDYADAEFTRDTVESNARARVLYETALDILNEGRLIPGPSLCQTSFVFLVATLNPDWIDAYNGALSGLAKITDAQRLAEVNQEIQTIIIDRGMSEAQRFESVRATVRREVEAGAQTRRLTTALADRAEAESATFAALLARPALAGAALKAARAQGDAFISSLSTVAEIPEERLTSERIPLPWLRERAMTTPGSRPSAQPASLIRGVPPREQVDPSNGVLVNAALTASPIHGVGTVTPATFVFIPAALDPSFCTPENPVPQSLKLRAESNLHKLRNCLNIAGMLRQQAPYAAQTDSVTGLPQIGAGGQLILPALSSIPATAYRYNALIERAKELVSIAQQVESAFLSALEKRDQAAFTRLQARQNVEMSGARVQLQQLRIDQARKGIKLAALQRDRAQIQVDTFDEWISAGLNQHELDMLQAYDDIAQFENNVALARAAQQGIQAFLASLASVQSSAAGAAALPVIGFAIGQELANVQGVNDARRQSQASAAMASFERRLNDWKLSKSIATQDVLIGAQQMELAESQLQIVGQEFVISELEASHARETLEFLDHQFTNVELFAWMSDVLESVYSYFLQQATSMARLAENQLAFERQEPPPAMIQSDYWNITIEGGAFNDSAPDRKGLTGSARLLEDLYRLDQYAFNTNRRKLQLSKTISLAQLYPEAFQRFRETGVMVFETPLGLFDHDFPGHYLRLIKQVRTSVAALIPPVHGIKATLSTTGASRVVVGGEQFQTVVLNRGPESVALTSPLNATGVFELNPQPELLLPFEGIGVDATWEFRLPKAANFFNYDSIADVLFTIDYTALDSNDYRQQVIQAMDSQFIADRAFSFRQQFPDAWYDLHNPDQTATPMVVRFQTTRSDFPPNLDDLRIAHVVLYFSRQSGRSFEVAVEQFSFTPQSEAGALGGAANSIDGIISTRRGNATSWLEMIGRTPIGEWELALPDTEEFRNRLRDHEIEEVLFVLTYSGVTLPFS